MRSSIYSSTDGTTRGGILTSDETGTPITSPKAYTTGVVTLVVPKSAAEVVLQASTAIRVSEVSDVSTYFPVAADTPFTLPCANMTYVYVKRESSSGNLFFMFMSDKSPINT